MEAFQDFEAKETCPYDKAHRIRSSKLAVHIAKCAKNHPNVEVAVCDFNVNHIVQKPDLRYHHETCPDRKKVETFVIETPDESSNKIFPIKKHHIDSEENWDDEPECPSYDPKVYCEQNNVLRHIDVASASKRRNFRLDERQRLSHLKEVQKVALGDERMRMQKSETNVKKPPTFPPSSCVTVQEDAPHLSLTDRIRKGQGRSYKPT